MTLDNFPWLTVIGLIPAVGAFVLAFFPPEGKARPTALGFSLVTLALTVVAALRFDRNATEQFQLVELHRWIPQWGISYALGVDGMALAMIVMSAILVPICILAAWHDIPEEGARENKYFAWMLLLETFIIGVFSATDVVLFYVFFEAMLIPVFFLIGSYGGPQRTKAAMKFLLFSLAGGLVMLVSVVGLYFQGRGGSHAYLVENLTGLTYGTWTERWLFLGFFIAFAVKAPMVPVHTWLPEAAEQATPATSVLLVGVLDKVGTYGMIRFCLQLFPGASEWATPAVIVLALVSIIWGGLAAIGQSDLLRLIAFTSVSHFGFIVMGIFAFTRMSNSGSVLYMLNHGFTTAALFLVAGMLIQRGGSTKIADYGGWQRVTPVLAGSMLVAGLSGLALPGLGSFVSEFLVMMGTFSSDLWAGAGASAVGPYVAAISSVGIILAALYILLTYQKIFTGPRPGWHVVSRDGATTYERDQSTTETHVGDLTSRERWVVAPLILAFLVLGFFPKLALDVINPAVDKTLSVVGVTDPAPRLGVVEGSNK